MTQRTCEEPDCDKPHEARGLCKSHWKRDYGKRTFIDVACPMCGTVTSKRKDGRTTRRFCSLLCRDVWRCEQPDDPMYRTGARGPRGPRISRLPATHPVMWVGKLEPLIYGECAECAEATCSPARSPKVYCGQTCKRRSRNRKAEAKRRARREAGKGGGVSPSGPGRLRRPISKTLRLSVYARDQWTCWLCGHPTLSTYVSGDALSPTLDHVTPHSLGGTDDLDNLATAHAGCNAARGNTDTITWDAPVTWAA